MTRRSTPTSRDGRHTHIVANRSRDCSFDGAHSHIVEHPDLDDLVFDVSWWRRPVPTWAVIAYGPLHGLGAAISWWLR